MTNATFDITSSAAYTTHLNYNNAGSHYISMANGGATYFRGSSNSITALTVGGAGGISVTGNVTINTSGNGIDFSATSNSAGSMGSEVLDDYEEGSWTPTFPNNSGGNQTVGGNTTEYVKIGRFVYAFVYMAISGQPPNNSTIWQIGGLPYAPNSSGLVHHGFGNIQYVAGYSYQHWRPLVASNSRIYFHRTDGTNSTLTNAMVRNEGMSHWIMGFCYMTAS